MELPPPLRRAVDLALEGVGLADLTRAAEALSSRYRDEVLDGRFHLSDDLAARAYLATRLPATFAAVRSSLTAVAQRRPDFTPRTLLDAGAGPGSALWAAADLWASLDDAVLVEGSAAIRAWGERLGEGLPLQRIEWRAADLTAAPLASEPRDLVILAYVLNELEPEARGRLIDRLWTTTADTFVVIEPGTSAGWKRILEVRERLVGAGAHLLAPCPHAARCPLAPPDWCHFSCRVPRSRLHRRAKRAEVPWEDEKYLYLAASRRPAPPPEARVLASPQARKGLVRLKLCRHDGALEERTVSRRAGAAFARARRLDWGDALEER